MKLKLIVKSLALAGFMSTTILPAYAVVSPKDATDTTKKANDALYNQLPFADNTDFTNAHKGFIAALPADVIKGEQGNVIWDPQQYAFIKEGEKEADATITLDRATLNKIILKEETLKQAEDKGEVKVSGNGAKLEEMLGYMDKFEFWFNIVTP